MNTTSVVLLFAAIVSSGPWQYESNATHQWIWTPARSIEGSLSAPRSPRLGVECHPSGLHVIHIWGAPLDGDDDNDIDVAFAFDGNPPIKPFYWRLISSRRGAYMPNYLVPDFLKAAERARLVLFHAEDANGMTVWDEFDLGSFGEAVRRLPCFPE